MAKVFTASVLPSQVGNGHVSVTIEIVTSFSGEDVCSFQMPGGTLADLEGVLCDSTGPMSWCCPSSRLLFYTDDEPSRPLDLQRQVGTFGSLVIKHGDADAWLQTYPDTGKFLQAVLGHKFHPRLRGFESNWTAKVAGEVTLDVAKCLVHKVLKWITHPPRQWTKIRSDLREASCFGWVMADAQFGIPSNLWPCTQNVQTIAFSNIGWSSHVLQPPQWSQKQHPCYFSRDRGMVALMDAAWSGMPFRATLIDPCKIALGGATMIGGAMFHVYCFHWTGIPKKAWKPCKLSWQRWNKSPLSSGRFSSKRSLRWFRCSCACPVAELQKSKGPSMRSVSRCLQSCLPTSLWSWGLKACWTWRLRWVPSMVTRMIVEHWCS